MHRRVPIVLSIALALAAGGCASPSTTETASSTTTTAKAGAAGAGNADSSECKALIAYQNAQVTAVQKGPDQTPEKQQQILTSLDTGAVKLKKELPNMSADVDAQILYITKLIDGPAPSQAEKDEFEKAKNKMNLYRNTNCDKPAPKPTTTKKK